MVAKVFTLDTKPGIQRDGTVFDKAFYTDGLWVRFQRNRPRKIGGYRVISDQLTGPSRGIWINAQNAFTSIFSGYNNGLQVLTIDNNGVGAGVGNFTLSNFTQSNLNSLMAFMTYREQACSLWLRIRDRTLPPSETTTTPQC